MFFSSVAVMTRAYSDAKGERKDLLLLHEISSYLLLACGLTYVISVSLHPMYAWICCKLNSESSSEYNDLNA